MVNIAYVFPSFHLGFGSIFVVFLVFLCETVEEIMRVLFFRPFASNIAMNYEELPIIHVNATYNNTILTITDHAGK